ncbi:hypothetical protein [Thermus filiformis]|uniref:Uncharacterized protein n=1 Tax=Thermus filiformis TaxID=276 RepID=A0A0D6XAL9_THEFI|nr:hypothetical protein [Thermus filiformis]KIX84810.1 hypothetical protein THFILI_00535 [Thermus filiformis]
MAVQGLPLRLEANRRSSNDQIVVSTLREIQKAEEMYYGFNRTYTTDYAQLRNIPGVGTDLPAPSGSTAVGTTFTLTGVNPTVRVVAQNPTAPLTLQDDFCFLASTPAGQYWYQVTKRGVRPRSGYPTASPPDPAYPATGAAPNACRYDIY